MKTVRIGLLLWSMVFLAGLSGCEKAQETATGYLNLAEESVSEVEDKEESEEAHHDSDEVDEDEDD